MEVSNVVVSEMELDVVVLDRVVVLVIEELTVSITVVPIVEMMSSLLWVVEVPSNVVTFKLIASVVELITLVPSVNVEETKRLVEVELIEFVLVASEDEEIIVV